MTIEDYTPHHSLKEILNLDLEAVKQFWGELEGKYSQNDLFEIRKSYMEKGGLFAVGIEDGEIIACCGYIPISEDGVVALKRLRVRSDVQNKGYGKEILAYIEKHIKESGYKEIQFSTAKDRPATLGFYEDLGYTRRGEGNFGNLTTIFYHKYV